MPEDHPSISSASPASAATTAVTGVHVATSTGAGPGARHPSSVRRPPSGTAIWCLQKASSTSTSIRKSPGRLIPRARLSAFRRTSVPSRRALLEHFPAKPARAQAPSPAPPGADAACRPRATNRCDPQVLMERAAAPTWFDGQRTPWCSPSAAMPSLGAITTCAFRHPRSLPGLAPSSARWATPPPAWSARPSVTAARRWRWSATARC